MRKLTAATAISLALSAAVALSGCTSAAAPPRSPAIAPSISAQSSSPPSATPSTGSSARADSPSAQPSVATGATRAADITAVASVYEKLFNDIYHVSGRTKEKLASLNNQYSSLGQQAYANRVDKLVPAFKRIDDSNIKAKAAYIHSLLLVTLPILQVDTTGAFQDLQYSVDEEQVALSEDQSEASLPLSAVSGTYKGRTQSATGSTRGYAVKKEGRWLIDPTRG